MNKVSLALLLFLSFFFASAQQAFQQVSGNQNAQNKQGVCISPEPFVKTYGGINDEMSYGITFTQDSGWIITGLTFSFGAGSRDVLLVKINKQGNVEWSKTYGGASPERGVYAISDSLGYTVCAFTESFGLGGNDFYVFRVDLLGNMIWSSSYGSNAQDYPRGIQTTPNGHYILGGVTSNGAGNNDFMLIELNNLGVTQWAKSYGGVGNDFLHDIRVTQSGRYLTAGYRRDYFAGSFEAHAMLTESNGNIVWSKTYSGNNEEVFTSGIELSNGDFLLSGYTSSFGVGAYDVLVMRVNPSGNVLWAKSYGMPGNDLATTTIEKQSGNIYICVRTTSLGNGSYDMGLVEIDGSGNFLSGKLLNGLSGDELISGFSIPMAMSPLEEVAITGWSNSLGAGSNDFIVYKTDCDGNICNQTSFTFTVNNINLSEINVPLNSINQTFNQVNSGSIITTPVVLDSIVCSSLIDSCASGLLKPEAQFSTNQTLFCGFDSVYISNASTSSATATYSWDFGTGTPSSFSGESPPAVWYSQLGNHPISLIITDSCGADTLTKTVVFDAIPPAEAGVDTTICPGISTSIGFSGTGGITYAWSPSSSLSNGAVPNPSASPSTSTTYILSATNPSTGCSATDTVTVSVYSLALFNAYGDTALCNADSVPLGVNVGSVSSISWSPASLINDPNSDQVMAHVDSSTIFSVSITDTNACIQTDSVEVLVATVSDFEINADSGYCPGDTVHLFTDSSDYAYYWHEPIDTTAPEISFIAEEGSSGYTYFTASFNQSTCTYFDSVFINVYPVLTAFAGNDTTIEVGEPVQLTGCCGAESYIWTPFQWLSDSSSSPVATPAETITYTLIANNELGCAAIDTMRINVTTKELLIPNIITPNDDKFNDRFVIEGIYEPYTLEIFNKWGKRLHRQENYDNKWNADELSDGMYFYQITTESSQTYKGWVQVLR